MNREYAHCLQNPRLANFRIVTRVTPRQLPSGGLRPALPDSATNRLGQFWKATVGHFSQAPKHMHAFVALSGVAREIVYDNLATAVAEHDGRLVRFLPRFLAFAREYGFYPRACNPAAGWEKGKVERAIGYARQSFWPLREFTDLHDVNRQVRQWLSEVANQRQHRETRQRPLERFQPAALKPLPVIPYDHRDHVEALVHKDLRVQFDGNRYCVPHRYVGRRLIVKADSGSVTLYDRVHEIVSYPRSWRRGQTFGADRFEAEVAEMRPAARKSRAQQRLFQFLDGLCS